MSVDYDPKKAHEYYMQHRKLKGRNGRKGHSTKGWSQSMKEQWQYATHQLSEEHKGINQGITLSAKMKRKYMSEQASSRIKELREKLKGLPKEEKAKMKVKISGMIDSIRSSLASRKESLTERTKERRSEEKEAYAKRKDEAYEHIKSTRGKKR